MTGPRPQPNRESWHALPVPRDSRPVSRELANALTNGIGWEQYGSCADGSRDPDLWMFKGGRSHRAARQNERAAEICRVECYVFERCKMALLDSVRHGRRTVGVIQAGVIHPDTIRKAKTSGPQIDLDSHPDVRGVSSLGLGPEATSGPEQASAA